MRRLMLLRHAKTETEAASGRDFDRQLDPRGRSDAADIGNWLAQSETPPQRALVSPAQRARQTWDIVAPCLRVSPDLVMDQTLYNASPAGLMAAIREKGGDASVLIVVAHNPGLHEAALGFSKGGNASALHMLGDNLPTSGLVTIDFEIDSWAHVGIRTGSLQDLVTPKLLRGAAADST